MKKTDTRKLTLAKETLRALDGDLKDVMGGIISSDNKFCTFSLKCPPPTTQTLQ